MRKILLLMFVALSFLCLNAQEEQIQKLNIKSPEVTQFERFGEIPVSTYTGVPNISIPIYTIRSGDLNLPITLDYHASAIKVNQEATWVGLNWLLNAGGVISTSVPKSTGAVTIDEWKKLFEQTSFLRTNAGSYELYNYHKYSSSHESGIADVETYGWNIFPYTNKYNELKRTSYLDIIQSNSGEAQMHYANFMGYSFSFIYHPIQQKFIVVGADNKFVIQGNQNGISYMLDPNGNKYYFNETETYTPTGWGATTSSSYSRRSVSYYLTKIESPTGRTITLKYKNYGSIIPIVKLSETAYSGYRGYTDGYVQRTLSPEYFIVNSYLYEIESDDALVRFNAGSRIDLRGDAKKLDNIEVYDRLSNKLTKRYVFAYDYYGGLSTGGEYISDYYKEAASFFGTPYDPSNVRFTNDQINKRLRLKTLTEEGFDENGVKQIKSPYQFTYNAETLPGKTSASRDFWGNYNGKENGGGRYYHTFLSDLSYLGEDQKDGFPASFKTGFVKSDNRLNPSTVGRGLISRIYYPTGGYNDFIFEPHKISNYPYSHASQSQSWTNTTSLTTRKTNIDIVQPDEILTPKEFTITTNRNVAVTVTIEKPITYTWQEMIGSCGYIFKYNTTRSSDGSIVEYMTPVKQYRLTSTDGMTSAQTSKVWAESITLEPGKYMIRADLPSSIAQEIPTTPGFKGQRHIHMSLVGTNFDFLEGYKSSTLSTQSTNTDIVIPEDVLKAKSFILTKDAILDCSISIFNNNQPWEEMSGSMAYLYKYEVERTNDGSISEKWVPVKEWSFDDMQELASGSMGIEEKVGLKPGKYQIKAALSKSIKKENPNNNPNFIGSRGVILAVKAVDGKMTGDMIGEAVGVRIAQIGKFDGTKRTAINYEYDNSNGIPSGIMMNPLKFSRKKLQIYQGDSYENAGRASGGYLAMPEPPVLESYWIQSSNTLIPYSKDKVGYNTVKATYQESGYEIFKYWNKKDFVHDYFKPLEDPRNSNLLENEIYDQTGKLLKKISNTYSILNVETYFVNAIIEDVYSGYEDSNIIAAIPINNSYFMGPYAFVCPYGRAFINIYPSIKYWIEKKMAITEEYTPSGVVTNKIYYKYNSSNLLLASKEEVTGSDESRIQYFTYPTDYTATGTTYPNNLVTKNIIQNPLEVISTIKKGSGHFITSGIINSFNSNGQCIASSKLENIGSLSVSDFRFSNKTVNGWITGNAGSYSPNSKYVERLTSSYSDKGNMQYLIKDNNDKVTYLWGYNNQYPVAQIVNATYDQVKQILGQALIDRLANAAIPSQSDLNSINNLRANSTLSNAQIITYTYKPLIGVIIETDNQGLKKYYDYDALGRLRQTSIDDNGVKRVVGSFEYNYK